MSMSVKFTKVGLILGALALAGLLVVCSTEAQSEDAATGGQSQLERGKFLVTMGGCSDCHTPKTMTEMGPMPDSSLLLSGHPADLPVPEIPAGVLGPGKWAAMTNEHFTAWAGPWGVSFAANLTPDNLTGSGAWTDEAFIQAMRTGKHLGRGRAILPPMPWQAIGQLSDSDLKAMLAYLKSIPAIRNQVPQPIPPAGAPQGQP